MKGFIEEVALSWVLRKQEFFKVEGYLQQKEHVGKGEYQRSEYFNKLVQVKSNWSLKCVWQNGES